MDTYLEQPRFGESDLLLGPLHLRHASQRRTGPNSLATCASRRQGSATSVVPSATSVAQPAGCAGFQPGSRAPATNSTRTAKKSGARAPLPRLTTHSLHCSKPTLPHWPPPTLSRASRAPTDNSSLSLGHHSPAALPSPTYRSRMTILISPGPRLLTTAPARPGPRSAARAPMTPQSALLLSLNRHPPDVLPSPTQYSHPPDPDSPGTGKAGSGARSKEHPVGPGGL